MKFYLKLVFYLGLIGLVQTVLIQSAAALCDPNGAPFGGGDGSGGTPYQICSASQLNSIGNSYQNSNFNLESDIDLSGISNFNYIGTGSGTSYSGTFNGQGHKISNLTIDISSATGLGMFGHFQGSILNLKLENGSIQTQSGGSEYGLLVGRCSNGTITNVNVSGNIDAFAGVIGLVAGSTSGCDVISAYASGTISGESSIGGIVGNMGANSTIQRSTAVVNLTGEQVLGGIAGYADDASGFSPSATITESIALGSISGSYGTLGGLVGECGSCTISDSYSHASVTSDSIVGGLIGGAYETNIGVGGGPSLTRSYCTGGVSGVTNVGGAIGTQDQATAVNSYWNIDTTGQSSSPGGTGLTDSQSKLQASYVGFNFTTTWEINEGTDYPRLKNNIGLPTATPTVTPTLTSTATPTIPLVNTQTQVPTNTQTPTVTNTPLSSSTQSPLTSPLATATPLPGKKIKPFRVTINTERAGRIRIKFRDLIDGPRDYKLFIINTEVERLFKSIKGKVTGEFVHASVNEVPKGEYRLYILIKNGSRRLRTKNYNVSVN